MDIVAAAETEDLETFLRLVFPPTWGGIIRMIVESGAWMAPSPIAWAPRWSAIPMVVKKGRTPEIAAVKSVLYRTHDALHQLWGLPIPHTYSEDEYYLYKRAQMCGEVAVLCISEMLLGEWIANQCPSVREYIETRRAVPMRRNLFAHLSLREIGARMDGVLHRHLRPRWLRENKDASAFADYYVPMLEWDRREVDHNWTLLRSAQLDLDFAPTTRYSAKLDGQELTVWMLEDFEHLLRTGDEIDRHLARFNFERRQKIRLPQGWGELLTVS